MKRLIYLSGFLILLCFSIDGVYCQKIITSSEEMEKARIKKSKIKKAQIDFWYYNEYFLDKAPWGREIFYYDSAGNKTRYEKYIRKFADSSKALKPLSTTTYEYRDDGLIEKEQCDEFWSPYIKTLTDFRYDKNLLIEKREFDLGSEVFRSRTFYQYDSLGRIIENIEYGLHVVLNKPDTLSKGVSGGTITQLSFGLENGDTALHRVIEERYSYDEAGTKQFVNHIIPNTSVDTLSPFQPALYGYYEKGPVIRQKYNPQGYLIERKSSQELIRSDYVYDEQNNPIRKIVSYLNKKDLKLLEIYEYSYEYFK